MTTLIRRRLKALERLDGADVKRPILVITRYNSEPIGIKMPPPIPDVLRLPNESWNDLVVRAATRVPAATPVLLFAEYADEGAG